MLSILLSDWKELFREIVFFLNPTECQSLAVLCRSACNLICSDSVWQYYCLNSVPGFRGHTHDDLVALCRVLCIPSMQRLFCAFRNLRSPLLGLYSAPIIVPIPITNGGLFCIRVVNNVLVCHRISRKNRNVMCIQVGDGIVVDYKFVYDQLTRRVVAVHVNPPVPVPDQISFGYAIVIFNYREGCNTGATMQALHPLPPLLREATTKHETYNAQKRNTRTPRRVMDRLQCIAPNTIHPSVATCLGFFSANYGPHGSELLYLSIVAKAVSTAFNEGVQEDTGLPAHTSSSDGFELHALKITGDRNVPAGKLSFVIDLDVSCDIEMELQADHRPVLTFDSEAHMSVFMITQRAPHIVRWYRGRGQINYVPGTWEPRWVRCNLLIYDAPLSEGGPVCSVVWSDLGDEMRHAIDVTPAGGDGASLLGTTFQYTS